MISLGTSLFASHHIVRKYTITRLRFKCSILQAILPLNSHKTMCSCAPTNLRNTSSVHTVFDKKRVTVHLVSTRYFWSRPKKGDFHESDGVSKEFAIVYQGPMKNYVYWAHLAVLACPVTLMVLALLASTYPESIDTSSTNFIETSTERNLFLGAFLALSTVLHLVVRKFVLRIYYRQKTNDFIAIFQGLRPSAVRKLQFKGGEANKPVDRDLLNIFALIGSVRVKGKRIIVLEDSFQTPYYYNIMLGYTKPKDNEDET